MKKTIVFLLIIMLFTPQIVNAKQGCCSHHGGVKGCTATGRYICNDGELSPTCKCKNKDIYEYTNKSNVSYDSKVIKNDESYMYKEQENNNLANINIPLTISLLTGVYFIYKKKNNI